MTGAPAAYEVRRALTELLGWQPLARSPQLAGFLEYVVEKALTGEESAVKAYSIAVDVFGRPHSFDPQSDPIVRVQARRLRTLLDQYYAEGGGTGGVRIVLPVGRYVPIFELGPPDSATPGGGQSDFTAPSASSPQVQRQGLTRRGAFVAGAAVAILIVLLIVMLGGGAS